MGTLDGTSPLSVQVKTTAILGLTIPSTAWVALNFPPPEVDTHQGVTPGPLWRWVAPMRGVYHLVATVRLEPLPPAPTWQLRVLKSGQVVAEAAFTGFSGQIAWLGALMNPEDLQVQIWSSSAAMLSAQQPVLPATVSIAGVGVVL